MSSRESSAGAPPRARERAHAGGALTDIQRGRLLGAMADACRERGVAEVTVADVVARSAISRRTFYEVFSDREDCFVATFDRAVLRAGASVIPAYQREQGWSERIRAGLQALLGFLDDEPAMGAVCVLDSLAAGPRAVEHRARIVSMLVDAVDEGRECARADGELSRLNAEGVVGAVIAVIHTRMLARSSDPLTGLLGRLMSTVVLPYLGPAAAQRELARPTPRRARARGQRPDPLRGLNMRLTYRTVRVLAALCERPGLSNRQVGDEAGVVDPGQISKLLFRLERLGLVRNGAGLKANGAPNSWKLTPRGSEVERALRVQSDQR
jgi:AcrR family transcriptional regulator/DNA-binding MarR family transcriptional regulator